MGTIRKVETRIATMALAVGLAGRPRTVDGTGLLLLNGQWQGIPTWCREVLGDAVAEIEMICARVTPTGIELPKARHAMVNVVLPGGGSGVHSDPAPLGDDWKPIRFERWHLPLQTNPGAWFMDGGVKRHLEPGFWHGPVEYWFPHAVGNDGPEPRMHLVIDLR